jgi:hypothetical protein
MGKGIGFGGSSAKNGKGTPQSTVGFVGVL